MFLNSVLGFGCCVSDWIRSTIFLLYLRCQGCIGFILFYNSSTERTSTHGQTGHVGYWTWEIHILVSEKNMSDTLQKMMGLYFWIFSDKTSWV